MLAACGGNGDTTTDATPATPSSATVLAYGSISGFGSVIIHGVRCDDSLARDRSEDSDIFDRRDLGLGMAARVEGSLGPGGTIGMASVIEIGAALRGPVTAVSGGGVFAVLGIPVTSSAATVWVDMASPETLAVGQWVEVHGLDGADGSVTATRVETTPAGVIAALLLMLAVLAYWAWDWSNAPTRGAPGDAALSSRTLAAAQTCTAGQHGCQG
ncbi:MAG: DUF5666 domain-containing protein [Tepidimonas sp.]|uniref:DUF5666 domain-containing protein n=1 Tax=Tepidimonas sp. TaxID=2002775 RepID=UPI00259F41F6|nr:DUF5666 domain-containing protein [Tepidimonas sp.]MDM7457708.1 DUF5666 domain-containing protein [Tepidimonas sp.]